MKILWLTDLHLDFLNDHQIDEWCVNGPAREEYDIVVITGDTSVGPCLVDHLRSLKARLRKPVFFVCGNHDFWESSWEGLHSRLRDPRLVENGLTWMGTVDFLTLSPAVALVGHDGWYDGRHGKGERSRFVMNDWFKIREFKGGADLLGTCRRLAKEGAEHVAKGCASALSAGAKEIVILTHFPPFPEVCLYRGRPSEPDALPWYTSAVMGETLVELVTSNRDVNFRVLCGHTHSSADRKILPNLHVIVGSSEYGSPSYEIIEVA